MVAARAVDRLGRSLIDLLGFLGELHAKKIDLYLHQQGLDTSTPAGRAMLQMLGVFAEFERDRISTRIRESKQRQKANGEYLGDPPPFGYRHDENRKLVPVPEQQSALRRIQKLAAKGLSPYKISTDLADRGVKLSLVTVRKIIAERRTAA